MQIEHRKNTAFYLAFPMVDSASPASFDSGVSPTDDAYSKDGAGVWSALAIADTASEIGSTGVYEIDLTAAELNHDQVLIKFTAGGSADTAFLFDMGGASQTIIGSPAGADLSADIAAVKAQTADIEVDTQAIESGTQDLQTQIGTAGAGLTDLGGMSTGMKAEVESEANDALVANHLDHLLAADYDPASKPGTATALLNELVESDSGVSRFTRNALEATNPIHWVPMIPPAISLSIVQGQRAGFLIYNANGAAPTATQITPGTITIARKGVDDNTFTTIVSNQAMSDDTGIVYYDEVFGPGSYMVGDVIRFQFAGVSVTVNGHVYELAPSRATFYGHIRRGPNPLVSTTVASKTSETVFTLGAGSGINDSYNGMVIQVSSILAPINVAMAVVSDYVGSTKQITLVNAFPNFPIAVGDPIEILYATPDAATIRTQVGTAGVGLTNLGGMSTSMKAEVQTEANDALVANHLDHLLAADYDPSSKPGVATALLNEVVENDGGVSRFTANALEQGPGGGNGSGFTSIPWNASWDTEVQSEVQDAIEANHLDHLLAVNYDPASKPGVSTALLNEMVEDDAGVSRFTANALEQGPDTDHTGTGSGLTDLGGMSTAMKAEVNAEVDAALNTAIPGSPTADSINERIKAMDDAYTAARGALLNNLDAAITTRATPSQVNTEVVDVLQTDTHAEPTAAPAFPMSVRDMLTWVTSLALHQVEQQAGGTKTLRRANDSTKVATATITDSGTTTTHSRWT